MTKRFVSMVAAFLICLASPALAYLPYSAPYTASGTGPMDVTLTTPTGNFQVEQVILHLSGPATSGTVTCWRDAAQGAEYDGGRMAADMSGIDDWLVGGLADDALGYKLSDGDTFRCSYPNPDNHTWAITIWYRR